ncbi:MAG: hypothetical protein HY718_08345 [Planctomycetes bacterium]|nr:hypothetical protein [Planctomycetota bacterium]
MLRILATLTGETFDANSMVAMLLAAIAGFMLITGMRRRQRERAKQTAPPVPRRFAESASSPDSKENLRRDLERLIGELHDLSRKLGAEIDTRFAKLETALRDADRRIAVLNRLARTGGEKAGEAASDNPDEDVRYAVVYELADAGFSPVEIAKDLGRTPGEIELILNLRRTARQ